MLQFEKHTLANGLRVIVHEDKTTPMVAVNVVYHVGSKFEHPEHTGFAHLFEHLMFGGSIHIPDFDGPIQLAGGENNAFTNTDLTNFYEVLPACNIETALWLESDRMMQLKFNKRNLDTQKKVVIEEFKETCLEEPYGDMWHHMSQLAYSVHPYRWPTIGMELSHISTATLQQVEDFFFSYYRPSNAVIVLAGNISPDHGFSLVEKWFADIPSGKPVHWLAPSEPAQQEFKQVILRQDVPHEAVYQGFHMAARLTKEYYAADLLSDVLANGRSSRFYQKLYKEKEYFSTIDAFISGSVDPGLFLIEGKTMPHVSLETAVEAIWRELNLIASEKISDRELTKLKNSVTSSLAFSEASILNKAISFAYFEILGDAAMVNEEAEKYMSVSAEDIRNVAASIFRQENCNEVIYLKEPVD